MIYITRGLLNGAGDAMYSLINGIMEMCGRIGLAKPLTMIGAIGVWGVWLATGLTWLITGLISLFRYLQGKMERKRCGRACPERKTACGCIKERKRTWKISCLLPFYLSCKYFARKELGVSFRYFKKQRLNVEILANPDISATSVMESVALASSSQARFKRSFVINST